MKKDNQSIQINITFKNFIIFSLIMLMLGGVYFCQKTAIGDRILGSVLRWDEGSFDKSVWGE